MILILRLHVNAHRIDSQVHLVLPTLSWHHLKQSVHSLESVVKVGRRVNPLSLQIQAVLLCFNSIYLFLSYIFTIWFLAAVELSFEETNSHNGKDQKEKRAYHKDILHGSQSGEQSIDDKLQVFESFNDS